MEKIEKRDIADYEENYSNAVCGFEKYKVLYRRRKILEVINTFQPTTILEIGCGPEPLFYHDSNRKFTVVEPSDIFFENAQKLSELNKNVRCIKGFFEEVAYVLRKENISYDMVVCSSLLHEVTNPDKLLEVIKWVCDKNTIIHISVPNMYSIHRLLGVEMNILSNVFDVSEGNKILQQNTNFDLQKLRMLVQRNEMIIEEEGSYFVKPFSHKQMEDMIEKQIIDEHVLDGLYKLTEYMPQFGSEIYVNCKIN